jgi:hypothetical protein
MMSYWSDPAENVVAVTPNDSTDIAVPQPWASVRRGRQRASDDGCGSDRDHPAPAGLQPHSG